MEKLLNEAAVHQLPSYDTRQAQNVCTRGAYMDLVVSLMKCRVHERVAYFPPTKARLI